LAASFRAPSREILSREVDDQTVLFIFRWYLNFCIELKSRKVDTERFWKAYKNCGCFAAYKVYFVFGQLPWLGAPNKLPVPPRFKMISAFPTAHTESPSFQRYRYISLPSLLGAPIIIS